MYSVLLILSFFCSLFFFPCQSSRPSLSSFTFITFSILFTILLLLFQYILLFSLSTFSSFSFSYGLVFSHSVLFCYFLFTFCRLPSFSRLLSLPSYILFPSTYFLVTSILHRDICLVALILPFTNYCYFYHVSLRSVPSLLFPAFYHISSPPPSISTVLLPSISTSLPPRPRPLTSSLPTLPLGSQPITQQQASDGLQPLTFHIIFGSSEAGKGEEEEEPGTG